ncbi:hypothetical protein NL676_032764 [Syzygium grande]|nr:hypothetical protein NL676_032764 [Syzygium grande]
MILKAAETAKVLHIIDFGINFGFQWPILIQELSKKTGGVPKLRITGIELPQPGFRPAERIEETGRRLTKYCERFNVPLEFQAVASASWECIKVADLNIRSDEVVAVNCLSRLEYLYDETVEMNCQRDMVLNLIRSMERVERPETYKQWQVRLTRVGFQQLPLDQEFIKKARAKLRGDYHKDFVLDEENNWMLLAQGEDFAKPTPENLDG